METIPWLSITAASGGWTLFGMAGAGILTGFLVPKWVVALLQKRIETLETENKLLLQQNALLLREGLPTTNAILTALRENAEREAGS